MIALYESVQIYSPMKGKKESLIVRFSIPSFQNLHKFRTIMSNKRFSSPSMSSDDDSTDSSELEGKSRHLNEEGK